MVDTITHGLIGAFVSRLGFRQKHGKIAAAVMVLSAILPDFDMILNFWGDEITYKNHRGFTHSIFGAIVISLILALIFYFFSSYKRFLHLFLFSILGITSHIILDLLNSYGTQILNPLSNYRYGIGAIFILDFFITIITVLSLIFTKSERIDDFLFQVKTGFVCLFLSAFFFIIFLYLANEQGIGFDLSFKSFFNYLSKVFLIGFFFSLAVAIISHFSTAHKRDTSLIPRIGLVTIVIYVLLCLFNQRIATNYLRGEIIKRGENIVSISALAMPVSPFAWMGVAKTKGGNYYQCFFHFFNNSNPGLKLFRNSKGNRFIYMADNLETVKLFKWFARFPIVYYSEKNRKHIVEYFDLRYYMFPPRKGFSVRAIYDNKGNLISVKWLEGRR